MGEDLAAQLVADNAARRAEAERLNLLRSAGFVFDTNDNTSRVADPRPNSLSRKQFDSLDPSSKMDHCRNGGLVYD